MQDVGDGAGNRTEKEFCLWVLILIGSRLALKKLANVTHSNGLRIRVRKMHSRQRHLLPSFDPQDHMVEGENKLSYKLSFDFQRVSTVCLDTQSN